MHKGSKASTATEARWHTCVAIKDSTAADGHAQTLKHLLRSVDTDIRGATALRNRNGISASNKVTS